MKLLCGGLVLLLACGGDDKTADCHLGDTTSEVLVQDRKVIGPAAPYAPSDLASREEELRTSIAARRAAAWDIVAKVLAPVPLGDPGLAAAFGGQPSIPAWHTWYGRDDYERIFKHLYRGLGAGGRSARSAIDPAAGYAWAPTAVDEIPEWPEQRYMDYLASIDTQTEANGVGGNSRVGYSPGALAHLLTSYEQLHQCRLNPAPDAFAASPTKPGQAVAQAMPASVAKCDFLQLGVVQAAGAVTATMKGDGDADLYVKRGGPPTPADYDCKSDGDDSNEKCVVDGGPVYIAAFGAANASAITVDVTYTTADVTEPTCLGGEMTRDSVLVKADWIRQLDQNDLLPVFITSGERMTSRFDSDAAWTSDGNATPGPSEVYTVTLPSTGAKFRMPALHIMSKELDHWVWITLWYSAFPDDDFGADRPAAIAALGPWRNYKMCVTTGYNEGDPDPRGGFAGSLGDALAAVYRGTDAPTWCSNPYLEEGEHNARTNCIGCHQHGGTELTPEEILAKQPEYGVTRTRNNFFTDYLWAVKGGGGEDLSALVQAEIDYWDATDP